MVVARMRRPRRRVSHEVGPHCTDMTTDSQRNIRPARGPAPRAVSAVAELPAALRPDGWLGTVLVVGGVLTPAQLDELGPEGGSLWTAALAAGWADDGRIVDAIARRFRLPVANLAAAESRTLALVPEALARKHHVMPLAANDRIIQIATADPRDLDLEQTLRFVTGRDVAFQIASPITLAERIDELYRPARSIERLLTGLEPARLEAVDLEPLPASRERELEAPVAKLVDAMITDAVREGASDIHAEPTEGGVVVRYRVDGVLREVMRLPDAAGAALVRRVKIWAKLDVTDPLRPHDGRAAARVDGQSVDLRVSTIPVARRGEKVVVRILDKTNLRNTIADLGLAVHERDMLERLLGHREGMLLVTGPTGSGKTTTLYAALNQLKTGRVNIVTVEDPVEYEVAGISQIQVNEAQGLTFATALRSVLRQDPDIVLVGEIRDLETATTAIQAGFSGHFVLSTLHTNDAPSTVMRLRDMGIDAFKVASVLKGVVAQRLLRRLCDHCAEPVSLDSLTPDLRPPAHWARPVRVRKAVGCRHCNGRGYRGRLPVFEIMPVDETVARLIDSGALPDAIAAAARKLGMRPLWETGLERLWDGDTSLEEMTRVLGDHGDDSAGESAPGAGGAPESAALAHSATGPKPTSLEAAGATPASDCPGAPPVAPADRAPAGGATRVLIADDDPQMRRLIRSVLVREGFDVLEAGDGLDALDAIERGGIDLLILDLEMPRLDGLGVLDELHAQLRTAALPVIVLTAQSGENEEKALDLGAQDYLTKPVQTRSLTARVRAVLKRSNS
jgi:type II secretory ATPase GspE/PulE/Tfp pilus assembly ATPase PilB-like protein/ActR/RegA family two-component response regulator